MKLTEIPDNTFAAACYDQNSIADLEEALRNGPDATDMHTWGINEQEWKEQIEQAIAAKREDLE
jgi:hypothetical protein